jgi:hypothetical protein
VRRAADLEQGGTLDTSDTALRRVMILAGAVGVLVSLVTLPAAWGLVAGQGSVGWAFNTALPPWIEWHTLSQIGLPSLMVGALSALLLVSGPWPARVFASVAAVATLAVSTATAPGSYWMAWMANHGNGTPLTVVWTTQGVLLGALGVIVLVLALRLPARGSR